MLLGLGWDVSGKVAVGDAAVGCSAEHPQGGAGLFLEPQLVTPQAQS